METSAQCWGNVRSGNLHGVHNSKEPPMKKLVAAALALTVIAGFSAPAFAWSVDNCPFTNKAMCETSKSLVDTTTEDE